MKIFFPFAEKMLEIYENDFSVAGITADYKLEACSPITDLFPSTYLGMGNLKRSWKIIH